jgi:hypothetical protein
MVNTFAEVIFCKDKKSLTQLCKVTTVPQSHFVDFILACKAGLTHLNHTMHYVDYVPDHLMETDQDLAVLKADKAFQQSKQGQVSLRKVLKDHGERKYKVGHMFVSKELQHPIKEWHFVCFEIKELTARANHWQGGPHVHITNHLWPNLYCQPIWEDFVHRKIFPSSKLHLSFIDPSRAGA